MRLRTTPYDRERRFIESLNIELLQKALWPLLTVFILFNFWDTITTLYASVIGPRFIEYNPLGSALFRMGFQGFMVAYVLKFVPVIPLFYMVAFQKEDNQYDFEARLLKYAAFVVLVGVDIALGAIVFGSNLPLLMKVTGT